MLPRLLFAAALLIAPSLAAQRPVFEPDDFVDPAARTGTVFVSRMSVGGVWNPSDRFRPIQGNFGFVLLTNSLYVDRWQFDYKHTEMFGEDEPAVQRCDCPDPVYFPTPPPPGATPAAPPAGRIETLQLAFYGTKNASSRRPLTLQYRLSWSRQEIGRTVTSATTGRVVERQQGHDQSFTLEADTHLSIHGRDVWGSLYVARASRSGTHDDRVQNELAYVYRPAGWAVGDVLLRTKLTLGGISDRGATGLNLVNPYFEAFWRHRRTKVNFHLVWSAERTRSGAEGWRTNQQIAVFVDRTLYSKSFGEQ